MTIVAAGKPDGYGTCEQCAFFSARTDTLGVCGRREKPLGVTGMGRLNAWPFTLAWHSCCNPRQRPRQVLWHERGASVDAKPESYVHALAGLFVAQIVADIAAAIKPERSDAYTNPGQDVTRRP
jgi:hypothetical protein